MTLNKGPYYYSSKEGAGVNAWIGLLREHYDNLAALYRLKGMNKEAEVFGEVVEEFDVLQQQILAHKSEKNGKK
jgi:hypothetical protein